MDDRSVEQHDTALEESIASQESTDGLRVRTEIEDSADTILVALDQVIGGGNGDAKDGLNQHVEEYNASQTGYAPHEEISAPEGGLIESAPVLMATVATSSDAENTSAGTALRLSDCDAIIRSSYRKILGIVVVMACAHVIWNIAFLPKILVSATFWTGMALAFYLSARLIQNVVRLTGAISGAVQQHPNE